MRNRIALFSVLGFLIIALLLGTFFDLSISQALANDPNNLFLHIVSAYGLVIPYSIFAFIGGLLIRVTIDNKEQKLWLKILLIALGCIASIAGVYFCGHDNFSVNGLNKTGLLYDILAIVTGLVFCSITFILGFISGKNNENKRLWVALVIVCFAVIVSQLFGTIVLKSLFHRPRYRSLGNGLEYQPWYLPFANYKSYITDLITKEEFKSFPSGHSSVSALMMFYAIVIPPMVPNKLGKRLCFPLFFVGLAYFVFIAFVRILAGAHFLSDVSFGGLLTVLFSVIAVSLIEKFKLLDN